MRAITFAIAFLAADPILIERPDAFKTLVNPNCSHCVDEAKRRSTELTPDDPVLCWTRGYSDGGAIPIRFFLNTYRVISDSYGVFVYDPEAGYARGFAPSYQFVFHGWRNGIMVMKDTSDGTLYSCLSGEAFAGPRQGHRLTPIPTMMSTWGEVIQRNPNAVAYQMFEKYQPVELPKAEHRDSVASRPAKVDSRLKADERVLGVRVNGITKAYPLTRLQDVTDDAVQQTKLVILRDDRGRAVSAYRPVAHQPRKYQGPRPNAVGVSPPNPGTPLPDGVERSARSVSLWKCKSTILDHETSSHWDVAGRSSDGELKGWTLEPVESVVCTWRAWSTEFPATAVFQVPAAEPKAPPVDPNVAVKQVAGTAEFLRLLPKPFATIKAIDAKARTVTLMLDGEKVSKVWPVEPDAEIKVAGWWGRLDDFAAGQRVWVWLKLDRHKNAKSIAMLADELSEKEIHGEWWQARKTKHLNTDPNQPHLYEYSLSREKLTKTVLVPASVEVHEQAVLLTRRNERDELISLPRFGELKAAQRQKLAARWSRDGLPGTATFIHVFSGEMDVMLDHEAMRWGRFLKKGDVCTIAVDPPIKAVVRQVTPWRERTVVRLVVGELAASDLPLGSRIGLIVPVPPKDIEELPYPTDIDRPRSKDERIEWFLASMYCVCGVGNDICTGDFYTLASCNPNGCGAPNQTRKEIGKLIDAGKTDRQIWDDLVKDRGPEMTLPHLRK